MIAEIISVGTELLLGNIVNTNAQYLAEECAILGLSLYHQTVVGDNEHRLLGVIKQALSRSDILILTGGLGPTQDDLTKEVVAEALGKELVVHEPTKAGLIEHFSKRHIKMTENNLKQSLIPEGSIVLENSNGTAPGLIVEDNSKTIILLPGPPKEMIPLFEYQVMPYLKRTQPDVIYSRMVKIAGLGESFVETEISDLIKAQTNPTIAPYAKDGEVHLRLTAKAKNEEEANQLINPIVEELERRFGVNIFSEKEDKTLEQALVDLLDEYKLTISTAESCSGGLLSARLINCPGASSVFQQGVITYSNQSKIDMLKVSANTIDAYGAVSEETAIQMAEGIAKLSGTSIGVSITGNAGPSSSEGKPVGLVYIGCYVNGTTIAKECHFTGNRQKIRNYCVVSAIDFLRRLIIDEYE